MRMRMRMRMRMKMKKSLRDTFGSFVFLIRLIILSATSKPPSLIGK